jgi:hypothetical protein
MHATRRRGMRPEARVAGSGGRGGRGGRGRRSAPEPVSVDEAELAAWFAGSVPGDWFTRPLEVRFDHDEIQVVGTLAEPDTAENQPSEVAESARIETFREETRERRIAIAQRAEQRFERKVSWIAACGSTTEEFTVASVPAMTRLRFEQRRTLDTLIEAGVARSRSDALAWCVDLVSQHESDWIDELRSALGAVEEARRRGPSGS